MMGALVPVLFWAHICFADRQKTEKTGRRRGVGGGWAGGRCRRGDTQRLTASIMGVQQSAAWLSPSLQLEFRESSICICLCLIGPEHICLWESVLKWIVYWCTVFMCVCAHTVGEACVCVCNRDTSRAVAGASCRPQMRPLTDSSSLWPSVPQFILSPSPTLQAPFHFDGQYVLFPRNTRLLYN